jgi:hypothetical protein
MKHWLLLLPSVMACAAPSSEETIRAEESRPALGVVDSVFPVEEEIRRFKAQISGPFPTALLDAAQSREELARRFISALERGDSAAITRMAVSAPEFIELYYPQSQFVKPPYRQSPALLWFMIRQNSDKGKLRALTRYGGRPAGFRALECKAQPAVQGRNRLWECAVRWTPAAGKPDPLRLFGMILERDGRFKFLSFANDL